MQAPNPQILSQLGLCNTRTHTCDKKYKFSCLWLQDHPRKSLDHQHLWWLKKAATSTTLDVEILQGITLVEDMRQLFG